MKESPEQKEKAEKTALIISSRGRQEAAYQPTWNQRPRLLTQEIYESLPNSCVRRGLRL